MTMITNEDVINKKNNRLQKSIQDDLLMTDGKIIMWEDREHANQ